MRVSMVSMVSILATGLALSGCGTRTGDVAERDMGIISGAQAATPLPSAYPTQVFFGDTHLHTLNSGDAIMNGVRLTPEDALRFAMGENIKSTSGMEAKLDRPLDFLLVADHAELIGTGREIHEGAPFLMTDKTIQRWNRMMHGTRDEAQLAQKELTSDYSQGKLPAVMSDPENSKRVIQSTWDSYVSTVERYNNPGKFTALLGYEYTSTPKGNNLHRIVMYRDGAERVGKVLPFSALNGNDPEKLWAYMANYEATTGGQILAIPHNSNLSNGMMFAMDDMRGKALTADYARRRQRWEPIAEVTQIKGDSEAHPFLSPNDEFADFGKAGWDIGNLDNSVGKTNAMLPGDYVREALKRGLLLQEKLGINPFKYGMIGSTDSHTGLSTADDKNFFGKFASTEPRSDRATEVGTTGDARGRMGWHYMASGYAAVWAKENTRAAIFDAMMRKETYATTGPRMQVRFFGGWDFSKSDWQRDWVAAGYRRGVPMGGDLKAQKGKAPTFLVSALKDPMGANLDRVQIVKGWLDNKGNMQERVFDVVWSGNNTRKIGKNGKLTPVGDTVDLATASYKNSIGAAQLMTMWRDPSFDPKLKAFYYVRVLEIPTPRWPAYDALRFGVKMPDSVRMKDQERAYTSPIWYNPKG
jgi:hypothetical protein